MTSGVAWNAESWDAQVRRMGGHLLQSWHWGSFKAKHGWSVERVAVGGSEPSAMAQLFFRHKGPLGIAYMPRGPVFQPGDGDAVRELFQVVDERCRKRRAVHLIVETDVPLPFSGSYRTQGFVRGPDHFQPARTVKVPLASDETLLKQMHQKTRYSVRLAERRGVAVVRELPTQIVVERFYALLSETSERNEFGIHSADYYGDFVRTFGESAVMLFAMVDDQPAAGLIAARFGREGIYMYGASSTQHRAHGAAFALQFEAMKWAREAGCERYDLWGIPTEDPETTHEDGDRIAGTKGEDWRGLYKFKVGFGGEIVSYPPTLERRYRPFMSFAVRRVYGDRAG